MNYLITGFPGTGKSAVASELKRRGHRAYDPEKMRNYMHVEDRSSGRHIKAPADLPRGWYDNVAAYKWDPIKIQKLLDEPGDIYICSLAHNQQEFISQFSKIFLLTLDESELETRLRSRDGNALGKTLAELADIMTLHRHFEQNLINNGAVVLNTAMSVTAIVDRILDSGGNYPILAK